MLITFPQPEGGLVAFDPKRIFGILKAADKNGPILNAVALVIDGLSTPVAVKGNTGGLATKINKAIGQDCPGAIDDEPDPHRISLVE